MNGLYYLLIYVIGLIINYIIIAIYNRHTFVTEETRSAQIFIMLAWPICDIVIIVFILGGIFAMSVEEFCTWLSHKLF